MAQKQTKSKKETKKTSLANAETTPLRMQGSENTLTDILGSRSSNYTRESVLTNPFLSAIQRQEVARSVGHTGGNQYLHQFMTQLFNSDRKFDTIQRSDSPTGPMGISTEFGSFDVYPDDFIGPLPVRARTDESWAIRKSDFDNLNTRLTEVKNNASKLIITGTDAFKTGVMLDLGWLMTSSVGQDLVREIQDSAHTVTIQQGGGGNSTSYSPDADSYERPISPPQAGPGANVTINYNPSILFIKDGSLAWHHRPPAVGLAHEMVHAWTGVYGMRALYDIGGVNRRELQATGLGEFAEARISENRFRTAFGLPERPVY